MNSPTSVSPIDLERHNPPGQQRRGPTYSPEKFPESVADVHF